MSGQLPISFMLLFVRFLTLDVFIYIHFCTIFLFSHLLIAYAVLAITLSPPPLRLPPAL
jgi:hypothetical protein